MGEVVMIGNDTTLGRAAKEVFSLALCALLLFQAGCSSGQKKKSAEPSTTAETAAPASSRNQVRELRVQELETSTQITIEGAREPDFTVFKLNDPLRVVVDLANTELASISGPFSVKNGTVNEINTTQFDDASSSISRIIIGFDQVVDYEVVPEGTKLKINIQRIGARPADAQDIVARAPGAPPSEAPAGGETPPTTEPGVPSTEIPATETPMAAAADSGPVAKQIIDVKIDPNQDGLYTVTFVGDGRLPEPSVFRLENPVRLVVDFPGLTNGYAKKKLTAPAPLKTLRLGAHADKLRVVMDARAGKLPDFRPDLMGDRLLLRIGEGLGAPALAESGTPSPTESVVPSLPEETPAKKPTGKPVKIASLDFKQLPNASRIAIKVPESVSYSSIPYADGKVVVELVGATIPKALQRSLDTSEFDSPVTLVSAFPPKKTSGVVRLEVGLREDVPLNIQREGEFLNLDFERTKVFVAGAQPNAQAAVVPGPVATGEPASPSAGPEPLAAGEVPAVPTMEEGPVPPTTAGKMPAEDESMLVGKAGMEGGEAGSETLGEAGVLGGGGQRFTGRRISLDFKDADIKNIFRLIAEVSKLNIVLNDNVSGKITLRLINVPWDQALAIILQSQKLGIVRYDNILRIAPLTELEQERKEALSAKEAERDLEDLKVLVLPINYTKADDLKQKIQSLLTKRGRLTVDTRTNTLIIEDIQEVLVKARSLIKTLDTQTTQVVIDSRIVTAKRNWQRSLGIQWGGRYNADAAHGNPTGLAFPSGVGVGGGQSVTDGLTGAPEFGFVPQPNYAVNLPAVAEHGSLGITLGMLDDIAQLDLRLSALEDESKARVISSPRVTTLDNLAATISQGTKIPYATVSSAGTQTQFVDATLSLSVTPHVTNDRSIFMDLNVTNNSVGANTQAGPLIDTAQADTNILVKDGDTAVLGGIYVLNDAYANQGIPWLKKVPILKVLFSNYDRRNDRNELLFFITPRIVKQMPLISSSATN